MRNQEGIKIVLQKKLYRRICVRDITFLTGYPPFYVVFVAFFVYSPSQVTYLLNGSNKDMSGILCYVENMKFSCNLILAVGISKNVILF